MKPFLLLQSRPRDHEADNEYEAFMEKGDLDPKSLLRLRMEKTGIGGINLDDYSGLLLGGGPSNASDPDDKKSAAQKMFEPQLFELMNQIVERDFPFLGVCYGIGIVGVHQGGVISAKYKEKPDVIPITLTEAGQKDPITQSLPAIFHGLVGHKEACEMLPASATLLATTPTCPIQLYRVKQNIYVTQFHPELDADGLAFRLRIYKHAGYAPADEVEELIAQVYRADILEPQKILKNFAKIYQRA